MLEVQNNFVEWNSCLSVGISVIDEDHKAFFRLPALLREMEEDQNDQSNLIAETYINILEEYIEGHFLREQRALVSVNYADIAEHIAAHDHFSNKVRGVIHEYRNGSKDAIYRLGSIVTWWMFNHIITMDRKYMEVLNSDNVDSRPLVDFLAAV